MNEHQVQLRKENDLQRESLAIAYARGEDKTEIRGRRFSELSLGQCHISCILHRLFEIPAVRVVAPAKTSELAADNPSGNGAFKSSGLVEL